MNPRFIIIEGKPYLWRDLVRLRREQLRAIAQAKQLTLFEMRDDTRPTAHELATGRYQEPTLFD